MFTLPPSLTANLARGPPMVGGDAVLHLHRLENAEEVTGFDRITGFDIDPPK